MLTLEDKKALVAEVSAVAAKAHSAVVAEYRGLTAGELSELRGKAHKAGTYLRVVKNTLAKRAFKGTEFECLEQALKGPLILGLSLEDPGAAARVMRDFAKQHEKLAVKAFSVSGKMLPGSEIEKLASLPTRDQALSMLMGVMQAPIVKLARLFNEVPTKVTRAVAAVRDQKQAA
ncbi:MAG: 50S ribosomal protein L10 [Nevskiales bacterium]